MNDNHCSIYENDIWVVSRVEIIDGPINCITYPSFKSEKTSIALINLENSTRIHETCSFPIGFYTKSVWEVMYLFLFAATMKC